MSAPVVPTKTPLGQDELRRRAGGLGQRHRTILFLVDGRRPLSEVLSLAQQAGSTTAHFEDLVRLGYVQMPPEEPPPVTIYPPLEASAEAAELTHVELTVPGDVAAGEPQLVPEPVAERVTLPVAEASPEPLPEPATIAAPAAQAAPAAPLRPPAAPASAPAQAREEEPLAEVRRCLLMALRLDLTPFSFRAQSRVRAAPDASALVEIVWQMEGDVPHARRSHEGLLSLQRARELLGLGNTLVDEDSQSGRLEEDDW